MSAPAPRLYRSSSNRGHLAEILQDPRHIIARKLVRQVMVSFADHDTVVHTPEGQVLARPGDAILTGIAGEHWRVSRVHFADKYRPVPPTRDGESGAYVSLPNRIVALRMKEPFDVLLADGISRLSGHAGDWLVDYGDGSLGVVSDSIFAVTYEVAD